MFSLLIVTNSSKNPTNVLERLRAKAVKTYPDPNEPAVSPIDAYETDRLPERTRFDQDTALRPEVIRYAQHSRSVRIRRQFFKRCMAGYVQNCSSNLKRLQSEADVFFA